jgi:hypothetical protein
MPDDTPDTTATPDATADASADDVRPIENPPEIMWGDSRSLLLTLRHIQRVLRSDPDLAEDLLSVAYLDARQIVEDADEVVRAVRGRPSALRRAAASLAESIEGELEGDNAADEQADLADDE